MDIVSSENFDLMYSFVKHFSQLSANIKLKFTKFIVECVGFLSVEISNGGAPDGGANVDVRRTSTSGIDLRFLSIPCRAPWRKC